MRKELTICITGTIDSLGNAYMHLFYMYRPLQNVGIGNKEI